MNTVKLVEEIKQLPLSEKLYILELIFKDLREEVNHENKEAEARRKAAELLLSDYTTDEELTAFTTLDKEGFHE